MTLAQKVMFDVQDGMDMSLVRIDRQNGLAHLLRPAHFIDLLMENHKSSKVMFKALTDSAERKRFVSRRSSSFTKAIVYSSSQMAFRTSSLRMARPNSVIRESGSITIDNSRNGLQQRISDGIDAWAEGVVQLDDDAHRPTSIRRSGYE